MKLYHFPFAPNPARVLAYLREKQLTEVELVYVDFFEGDQNSTAHLARNARGIVPLLELDDGRFLPESVPIIEYLEECFPAPAMIGATPEARAFTRAMERDIELQIFQRLVRLVHYTKSPLGLQPNPELARTELESLPAALERVDAAIGTSRFVMGEAPTIADCTLYAGLNFSKFANLTVETDYPSLARWYDAYREHHEALPKIV